MKYNIVHSSKTPLFIFDYSFGLKKDKNFCPVFVYRKGMHHYIIDLVL